jgi:pyruvate kinase
LAITSDINVARRLQMVWGVIPLLVAEQENPSQTFALALGQAQQKGLVTESDLVVLTAGTLPGVSGSTDLVKVGTVSDLLGRTAMV